MRCKMKGRNDVAFRKEMMAHMIRAGQTIWRMEVGFSSVLNNSPEIRIRAFVLLQQNVVTALRGMVKSEVVVSDIFNLLGTDVEVDEEFFSKWMADNIDEITVCKGLCSTIIGLSRIKRDIGCALGNSPLSSPSADLIMLSFLELLECVSGVQRKLWEKYLHADADLHDVLRTLFRDDSGCGHTA